MLLGLSTVLQTQNKTRFHSCNSKKTSWAPKKAASYWSRVFFVLCTLLTEANSKVSIDFRWWSELQSIQTDLVQEEALQISTWRRCFLGIFIPGISGQKVGFLGTIISDHQNEWHMQPEFWIIQQTQACVNIIPWFKILNNTRMCSHSALLSLTNSLPRGHGYTELSMVC